MIDASRMLCMVNAHDDKIYDIATNAAAHAIEIGSADFRWCAHHLLRFSIGWWVLNLIYLFSSFFCLYWFVSAEYIIQCHRSDPQLLECMKGSLHHLRPYLARGIPEIKVINIFFAANYHHSCDNHVVIGSRVIRKWKKRKDEKIPDVHDAISCSMRINSSHFSSRVITIGRLFVISILTLIQMNQLSCTLIPRIVHFHRQNYRLKYWTLFLIFAKIWNSKLIILIEA